MEHSLVIFNPYNSNLEKNLIQLLKQEKNLNYYCIYSIDSLNLIHNIKPDLIFFILDKCCSLTRLQEIENIKSYFDLIPVVGILDGSKICVECELFRRILWSFISYPFNKNDILLVINWYCVKPPSQNDSIYKLLKNNISDLFIGDSEEALEVKNKIQQIAKYDVTVLINGETGTGKELTAKLIHYLGDRSNYQFVPVNCGAIPLELFENELFGHKKGAYTNADSTERGLIAEAENGTLFLDEIESLPELMQVKLLRFIEDKKYKPLGQSNYINSNIKIIAAAKEDLWEKVVEKKFREDLFYRLSIVNLSLPPLRNRLQDIPELALHFINRYSKLYNKKIEGVEPIAMMKMRHYNWEGNIRELQNILQQAVIMSTTGWIEVDHLNFGKKMNYNINSMIKFQTAKQNMIIEFEKSYLNRLLLMFDGNLSQAARFSGKDRSVLTRLVKKYNIDLNLYRNKSSQFV